jgi:hypothetical protein
MIPQHKRVNYLSYPATTTLTALLFIVTLLYWRINHARALDIHTNAHAHAQISCHFIA